MRDGHIRLSSGEDYEALLRGRIAYLEIIVANRNDDNGGTLYFKGGIKELESVLRNLERAKFIPMKT